MGYNALASGSLRAKNLVVGLVMLLLEMFLVKKPKAAARPEKKPA